jgi:hypothetical protein
MITEPIPSTRLVGVGHHVLQRPYSLAIQVHKDVHKGLGVQHLSSTPKALSSNLSSNK